MFGLIGKIVAAEGKREELIEILLDGSRNMPGNISYIVARDGNDPNGIWITEIWDSKESHENSLNLDTVQNAISMGRPFIEDFQYSFQTEPVAGA